MKWNNTILYFLYVIAKYKIIKLSNTNIKCWFGHDYEDTKNVNIKKCLKCNKTVFIIKAIYDEKI